MVRRSTLKQIVINNPFIFYVIRTKAIAEQLVLSNEFNKGNERMCLMWNFYTWKTML